MMAKDQMTETGKAMRAPFHLLGGFSLLLALSLGGCKKPAADKGAESAADAADSADSTDPEKADGAGGKKRKKRGASKDATEGESDEGSTGAEAEEADPDAEETSEAPKKGSKASEPERPKKAPRPEMSKKANKAFESGQKAFAAGDLQGAKAQYKAATDADAKAYEAHFAQGIVEERLGRYGAARAAYQRAYGIVPDHEESIVAYSVLTARQGKPDEAMRFLKKKSGDMGKSAAILSAMAEVASLQGQSGQAQEFAQQALKVDPSHKPAMVALARDHYRGRRIDLALYALTGILDGYGADNPPRDKNNAEARMIRGLIYAERGLRGPAMEEMEAALKQRPDLVEAHLVLANFMMEAGNAKDARKHLEKAIRYDNKNIAAHLQLGDAYRLLNKPEDAKRELEWVLAADANQAAAHYNLGLLYLLGGKIKGMSEEATIDKALEHLEAYKARAVRGGPDDVDDLITRAKTKKALLKANQPAAGT
jgi:Tfp pilus assembly protein PilF